MRVASKWSTPLALCIFGLLPSSAWGQIQPDSAVFVMWLGRDTTQITWTVQDGNRVSLRTIARNPRVSLVQTEATLNADGTVARLEQFSYDPTAGPKSAPTGRSLVEQRGDSTVVIHGDPSVFVVGVEPNSRPFLFAGRAHLLNDPFMVNSWPVLATFAPAAVGDSATGWHYPMPRIGMRELVIRRISPDWVTFHSDPMGTIRVRQDEAGRAVEIDAIGSSWNLQGKRVAWMDSDSVLQAFLAHERKFGPPGGISPSGSTQAEVHDASIRVDYARPYKRGRKIFGHVVPWNRVWRTGAGPATQITTDRPLEFGDVSLPAGQYSLWTLPAPEGWTLIINRQTGQWGTFYDPQHDFLRIPMVAQVLAEPVEQFTIGIEEHANGGVLRLVWDTTEVTVPFAVR